MPLKSLNSLLRVLIDHGYPLERALQHAGLTFNPLEASNPDSTEIASSSYSKLYGLLMELLQDEAFGLGQEYRAPPGTFRMMCLFIIHCRTLEQALLRAWEFHHYCDQYRDCPGERPASPFVELDDERVLCLFQRSQVLAEERVEIGHVNILLMMFRFYSWLIGRELPLREVHLRGTVPETSTHYEDLFGCPVRFGREHSGLVLPRQLLQYPLAQNEDSLREFLRQAPYPLVRRDNPGKSRPLSRQIEQLLLASGPENLPTASDVAGQLNMSARTLHRRLTAEGTSFQQLKDDLRREIAVHYIQRDDLSIDTIAAVMGFQDNSAFYRSFKKWTGTSPGQYRQQLQNERKSQQ
ncbi:AraC family transcriptional regulator [Seongchinamella sediminis]|nr:AraC family transcriptional regulator [Seongchinamella sediminis]